jgi:hypothetical protein
VGNLSEERHERTAVRATEASPDESASSNLFRSNTADSERVRTRRSRGVITVKEGPPHVSRVGFLRERFLASVPPAPQTEGWGELKRVTSFCVLRSPRYVCSALQAPAGQ